MKFLFVILFLSFFSKNLYAGNAACEEAVESLINATKELTITQRDIEQAQKKLETAENEPFARHIQVYIDSLLSLEDARNDVQKLTKANVIDFCYEMPRKRYLRGVLSK